MDGSNFELFLEERNLTVIDVAAFTRLAPKTISRFMKQRGNHNRSTLMAIERFIHAYVNYKPEQLLPSRNKAAG